MEALADRCQLGDRWKNRLSVMDPLRRPAFGHPNKRVFADWLEISKACGGVPFDLVYGGPAWNVMFQHTCLWDQGVEEDKVLCYVHSGGLSGHNSMLQRYRRRGYKEGPCHNDGTA